MKRFFTLIELIVVIAVLGILAAIIIPNISSFQDEANNTAIVSNVRNLQTSVDMYANEHFGDVPTLGEPTKFEPKAIDFDKITPEYNRDLPETEGVNYWVDAWGKVWASTIDAPTGVELDKNTSILAWNQEPEADAYRVYKVLSVSNLSGSAINSKTKLEFLREEPKDAFNGISVDSSFEYAVSAVDSKGFESPPAGHGYKGYGLDMPTDLSQLPVLTGMKLGTVDEGTYLPSSSWLGGNRYSIWNIDGADRGSVAPNVPLIFSTIVNVQSDTLTVHFTADNYSTLYVDGEPKYMANNFQSVETYTTQIEPGYHVIQIFAANETVNAGLYATILDGTTKVVDTTDGSKWSVMEPIQGPTHSDKYFFRGTNTYTGPYDPNAITTSSGYPTGPSYIPIR